MTWKRVGDYALSAVKFGAALAGVAAIAASHAYFNDPNLGTRDLVIAAADAVLVWLVPNRPMPKLTS